MIRDLILIIIITQNVGTPPYREGLKLHIKAAKLNESQDSGF